MIILAIRTDKPEAELYLYDGQKQLAELKWPAHLKLGETINTQIEKILNLLSISYDDLRGIAIYKGPSSFTSLRIGMTVANVLAYAQKIPIVANSGNDWLKKSIKALLAGQNNTVASPEYGAPARTT